MIGNAIPKMFCPECIEGKYRDEKYCSKCGNKLESVTEINGVMIRWE